jgi:hypothetical protein
VLTRALVSVLAAGLAAVLMLAAGQQAALAGGGPGGGNLVGSVTCGQSYSPQCDVTAGSGPSAGTPAGPGTQAGGQQAARTAAGGGAAGGCQGTVNKTFGCVPAGCQVTVQTLACPIGAAPAGAPAGAGAASPDPAVLAALGPAGSRPAPARPVRSGTARASGGPPARCPGRGTVSRISRPFIRIREPCREPIYLSSASWGFRAS